MGFRNGTGTDGMAEFGMGEPDNGNDPAEHKHDRRDRRILLKNSRLIGCSFADSIALLIGGSSDDGTEARSADGPVLRFLA